MGHGWGSSLYGQDCYLGLSCCSGCYLACPAVRWGIGAGLKSRRPVVAAIFKTLLCSESVWFSRELHKAGTASVHVTGE